MKIVWKDTIKYRVDFASSMMCPCGMNSIRYAGNNWNAAKGMFDRLPIGFDVWDKPNAAYGVILSVWDDARKDYIIKCSKGI